MANPYRAHNDPPEGPSWSWLPRALPATRWSLLARVRGAPREERGGISGDIVQAYWHPLYAYLRGRGYDQHDAQDHVQSFMSELLQKNWLAQADPEKGRLRHFLLTMLIRHVASRRRKEHAQKRGGGAKHLSLDETAEAAFLRDTSGAVSPDDCFRRALAVRLVDEGVKALKAQYAAIGQEQIFHALLPALEGVPEEGTFLEIARELGMRHGTVRMAALRLRERFRHHVRMKASELLHIPPGPALDRELCEIFAGPSVI